MGKQAKETKEFRQEKFGVEGHGAYVQVYQRPGEHPFLDLNFFDGIRDAAHAERLHETLGKAIKLAREWGGK
jgi:hypothetical protein